MTENTFVDRHFISTILAGSILSSVRRSKMGNGMKPLFGSFFVGAGVFT